MKRAAIVLATLVLAAVPVACGDDDDAGDGPTTTVATTTTESPDRDAIVKSVQGSGKFKRLAVSVGDEVVEAVLIEDCLAPDLANAGTRQFASYRAAAPPCRPVARVGVVPAIAAKPGDLLQIYTGTQTESPYVTFIEFGDPASRRTALNATQDGDTLQRWRVEVPEKLKVLDRIDIIVGPLRTDSGSARFAVRAKR